MVPSISIICQSWNYVKTLHNDANLWRVDWASLSHWLTRHKALRLSMDFFGLLRYRIFRFLLNSPPPPSNSLPPSFHFSDIRYFAQEYDFIFICYLFAETRLYLSVWWAKWLTLWSLFPVLFSLFFFFCDIFSTNNKKNQKLKSRKYSLAFPLHSLSPVGKSLASLLSWSQKPPSHSKSTRQNAIRKSLKMFCLWFKYRLTHENLNVQRKKREKNMIHFNFLDLRSSASFSSFYRMLISNF